ncbi:hypothetical protein DID88_009834 [Monilinia fructigena]|uniref:AMP-binding enzyme C-terminal domain-containing protein n=1 Tax=Monilinia fructigena TaxID=38457 RepID=A0A395IME8_9HELO|nr:hypothetical protein DID88_009834 [Monilinia fructigena]
METIKNPTITHFNAAPTVNTLLCAAKEAAKLPIPSPRHSRRFPPTAHLFETMTNLNLDPVHVYGMTKPTVLSPKATHAPLGTTSPERKIRPHGTPRPRLPHLPQRPHHQAQPAPRPTHRHRMQTARKSARSSFMGNTCAKEYYNDSEATAELFAGGVLHSGDLAVRHEDGSVQILDRAKDIIISGGENISSVALEAMLVQHDRVLEAGVVAVRDEKWGERPVAFVTVDERGMGVRMERNKHLD